MSARRRLVAGAVLVALVVAAGCASHAPRPAEPPPLGTVIRLTLRPPPGPGWSESHEEQPAPQAMWVRRMPTPTHFFGATVRVVQIDPRRPFEEAARPTGLESDPSRIANLTYEDHPDTTRAERCIRYAIAFTDMRAPVVPATPLQFRERGMVCQHATMSGVAVRASYAERGLPSEMDDSLWDGLDEFLAGVQLTPQPAAPH